MAVGSYDPTTGRPIFPDSGAPDIGVDPTEVGKYAAEVGNRIVKADLAALNAYPYRRAGLFGHALDKKTEYQHDGSAWRVWSQPWTNFTPVYSGFTLVGGAFDIAKYRVVRGMVTVKLRARVQSMTSNPAIDLPIVASDAFTEHLPGQCALIPGAGSDVPGIIRKSSTTTVVFFYHTVSGAVVYAFNIAASAPFAWGSTGTIATTFTYEAA